jgi:type III secretion protein U
MGEKTHEPTAQKLREARKKGQLPRSKLFTSSAVTLGGVVGTLAFLETTTAHLMTWTRVVLSLQPMAPAAALADALSLMGKAVAPTLIGALVASLVTGFATAGLQINAEVLTPKFERLNFIEGAKRLFSLKQLIEIGKGLLVTAIIGSLLWGAVVELAPPALRALNHDGQVALPALLALWRPVVLKAAVILLLLGVADQALARRRHRKDLMMSRDEVKQEHKNSEGDPHQKAKQKSMRKQIASGGPARGVKQATAVVVNPTHIAVALRYDEAECAAPYIVAKGQEEDALKIRKTAEALEIPVIRDVPLARTLIHYDVGEEVPEELYQAAAAVLSAALVTSAEDDSEKGDQS